MSLWGLCSASLVVEPTKMEVTPAALGPGQKPPPIGTLGCTTAARQERREEAATLLSSLNTN